MGALPANTTKDNLDAAADDPKQARAELATGLDATNSIISYLNGLFGSDGVKATALSTVGAQADLAVPSQAEAEAGAAVIERVWTAQRIGQAITALAGLNIMLNAFRIAVNGGLSVLNMVDGIVDEFEDETGIDTGISTNEIYDATNDLYTNSVLSADLVPVMTSNTAPSGTVTRSSVNSAGAEGWKAFDGNSGSSWTTVDTVSTGWLAYEFTATKTIIQYTLTPINPGGIVARAPKDWTFDGWNGSSWITLQTKTNETSWGTEEKRTYTFTNTTAYIKYRINVTANNGDGLLSITEMEMMDQPVTDMTLQSTAFAAAAVPVQARIVVFEQDVDAVALNTDLKAFASRDGGTTFTQITLADEGDYATGQQILAGSADISGQPSGSSMKWKLTTLNAKELKVHGVALQWS